MRNLVVVLTSGSMLLAMSSAFAQDSMQKNGMGGDSMSKEAATSHKAKAKPTKRDQGNSMSHAPMNKDPMGKDSMSRDSMKHDPVGGKPTAM
jgi:pentapeptide MXKDX repeat protein